MSSVGVCRTLADGNPRLDWSVVAAASIIIYNVLHPIFVCCLFSTQHLSRAELTSISLAYGHQTQRLQIPLYHCERQI